MHAEPAARANVGRHEIKRGFALRVQLLRSGRRVQPKGDAAVPVVVDGQHGEGLAGHLVVRHAMPDTFFHLRERQTHIPRGVLDVAAHDRLLQLRHPL